MEPDSMQPPDVGYGLLPAPTLAPPPMPVANGSTIPGRDSDRFYCPYPGCNRSFAELWRLKVHYRAPPDVRGSGKERGHGTELSHCPKCNKTLKPGKHHVGCSAARNTPRQAKRKGDGDLGKMGGDGSGKARRSGDGTWPGSDGGAGPYYGQPYPPYWGQPPGYGHPGAHPGGAYPPYAPAYGYPAQPAPGIAASSSGQLSDPHLGLEPATGIPVVGYPAHSSYGGAPPPSAHHPAVPMPGMPLPSVPGQPQLQPFGGEQGGAPSDGQRQGGGSLSGSMPDMATGSAGVSGPTTPSFSGLESSEPEFLANLFEEEEDFHAPGNTRVVPSPPPLPEDFHITSAAPNRLLFNFSQFSQKMAPSLHEVHATKELTDKEAHDLAEQHVVYDHTDDGELMQMLFGMADDVPTMATIHLHTWHNIEDEDAVPPPGTTHAMFLNHHQASSSGAPSTSAAPTVKREASMVGNGTVGAGVQGKGMPSMPTQPLQPAMQHDGLSMGSHRDSDHADTVLLHGQQNGRTGAGGMLLSDPSGPGHGLQPLQGPGAPSPHAVMGTHCQPGAASGSGEDKNQLGGGEFLGQHHLDLLASCGD